MRKNFATFVMIYLSGNLVERFSSTFALCFGSSSLRIGFARKKAEKH